MDLVDWDLAASTARRIVRVGPQTTSTEAVEIVRELQRLAAEAHAHVVAYTGLEPDPVLRTSVEVVDRATWAAYNVEGMRRTLGPLAARLGERRAERRSANPPASSFGAGASRAVSDAATRAGRAVTGAELGTVLAFLASRVLGQYETFLPPEAGDGRLLLVAPNIVEVQRRLGADPRDFRMWVCVHEQTHQVQFTAAPWLGAHLEKLVARFADAVDLDPRAVVSRLRAAARDRRVEERDPGDDDGLGSTPLAMLQSPEQRAVVAEIQALMTLLEGHADQVMDAVGPEVIPTVGLIRRRFEKRRRERGSPVERAWRKILGLDAKLAQYRVGGAFCRAVTEAGGPDAMRRAFAGPEFLPTSTELAAPQTWLARTAAARA